MMQVILNEALVIKTFFLTYLSIMMNKVRWSRIKLFSICLKNSKIHKKKNQMRGQMNSQRKRMRKYRKRDHGLVYLLPR